MGLLQRARGREEGRERAGAPEESVSEDHLCVSGGVGFVATDLARRYVSCSQLVSATDDLRSEHSEEEGGEGGHGGRFVAQLDSPSFAVATPALRLRSSRTTSAGLQRCFAYLIWF